MSSLYLGPITCNQIFASIKTLVSLSTDCDEDTHEKSDLQLSDDLAQLTVTEESPCPGVCFIGLRRSFLVKGLQLLAAPRFTSYTSMILCQYLFFATHTWESHPKCFFL